MANIFEKNKLMVSCSPFASSDMGQNPVDERTARGFDQYSHTFGKILSDKEGGKKFSEEEKLMRERAKKANKIYKQICEDLQLDACFFSNFEEWSQYVEGKMSDAEFQGHTIVRAQEMIVNQN